jgi:hypothetical protein
MYTLYEDGGLVAAAALVAVEASSRTATRTTGKPATTIGPPLAPTKDRVSAVRPRTWRS